MSVVHPLDLEDPAALACAQAGCPVCLEALLQRHTGLVHAVLRQQARGGVAYEDLLQEGRIALWQALLHFDPQLSRRAGFHAQRACGAAAMESRPTDVIVRQSGG